MILLTSRGPSARLAILLLALAVLIVGGALVAYVAHNRSRHPAPPDVWAVARSGAVRDADRAYAVWFGGELAQLGRAAPWLRPAGQSVLDECQAFANGGLGVGGAVSWSMSCQRTQTAYYAYTAAGGSRVGQLERALARIGWAGFTFTPGTAAAGGQLAAPAVLQAGYVSSQTNPAGKTGLIISWLSPTQTRAARDYVRFPVIGTSRYVDPIQVVRPDLTQISRAAAPPAGNLVTVELVGTYATPAASS